MWYYISEEPNMKTDILSTTVYSEGSQSESFFNIKQDNLAHIFGVLRNNMYSDKPLAVVREYCTNAYDAHVEAGIPETPIQVSVPSHITPALIVRDFGFGLSTDDVYEVFASYGASSKRNTNAQVGMLGLGSKSAFCYVDSFTVTSYHNGVKSIYNAYIDTTQIGKISLTHTEPTEESGLEIKIHVNQYDIGRFNSTIIEFLQYFNPKPVILNNDSVARHIDEFDKNHNVILSGENWRVVKNSVYSSSGRVIVSMGNVNYPVTISSIPSFELRQFIEGFSSHHIYVTVPIGSVKPSSSRESLDMNPSTVKTVVDYLNKVKDEIHSEYAKKIQNAKSMWEACLSYIQIDKSLGIKGFVPQYNGKSITSMKLHPKVGKLKSYYVPMYSHGRPCWKKETTINPSVNTIIFYHDKTVPMNSVYNRVIQHLDNTNDELRNNIHLLSFDSETSMNIWIDDERFQGANIINLADVAYINPKKAVSHKVVKSSAYIYTASGCRNYSKWKDTTINLNGEGVYLPIKRNICEDISFVSLDILMDNMRNLGLHTQIIGVRYDEVKNLGDGWVHYFDYCQQKGIEYIKEHDLQDTINKHFAYNDIPSNWFYLMNRKIDFGGKDIDLFLSNLKSTPYSISNLLRIERDIHKPIVNLTDSKYVDECNAIKDKYDLIPTFDMSHFSVLTDELLIKYVNMVN